MRATLLGGAYGAVLLVFAIGLASGSFGTYFPLAIFGAPIGLVGGWLGYPAVVLLWLAVGFAFGAARRPVAPAALLLIHLLGVAAVLVWGSRYESAEEQWRYLDLASVSAGATLWTAFSIYAVGQLSAWGLVARNLKNNP
jgi:hypothetical protein